MHHAHTILHTDTLKTNYGLFYVSGIGELEGCADILGNQIQLQIFLARFYYMCETPVIIYGLILSLWRLELGSQSTLRTPHKSWEQE